MKKIAGDVIILHDDVIILYVYQKFGSHDVRFLRYGAQQLDGQTNGRKDRKCSEAVVEELILSIDSGYKV